MLLATATRTSMATAVKDLIDGGSGAGKLRIYDSSDVMIVDLQLSTTCGTVASGVLSFSSTSPALTGIVGSGDGGTASKFAILDADDVVVFTGTIGASGNYDIIFNRLAFADFDRIGITGVTLTIVE